MCCSSSAPLILVAPVGYRKGVVSLLIGREARISTFLCVAAAVGWPTPARADNPIVQTLYTADPAPMVHEDKVYLCTSHDEDVTVDNFFTMNDWMLYSSADMVNWT